MKTGALQKLKRRYETGQLTDTLSKQIYQELRLDLWVPDVDHINKERLKR